MIYACAGCGGDIPDGEAGTLWCEHPLGMTTLRVHKEQACAQAALARHPDHTLRKGNQPPISRREREFRER